MTVLFTVSFGDVNNEAATEPFICKVQNQHGASGKGRLKWANKTSGSKRTGLVGKEVKSVSANSLLYFLLKSA